MIYGKYSWAFTHPLRRTCTSFSGSPPGRTRGTSSGRPRPFPSSRSCCANTTSNRLNRVSNSSDLLSIGRFRPSKRPSCRVSARWRSSSSSTATSPASSRNCRRAWYRGESPKRGSPSWAESPSAMLDTICPIYHRLYSGLVQMCLAI
jgi:hypothetical protein